LSLRLNVTMTDLVPAPAIVASPLLVQLPSTNRIHICSCDRRS
jgi:hypothetical protein